MRTQSFTRWIASYVLAALLLQVMAPLFAQSRTHDSQPWVEICTVTGTQWVQDRADDSGAPVGSKHSVSEHCVFCLAATPPDAPDLTGHLPIPASGFALPLASDDFIASFSGHQLRSRAPPL
jgi:hypothetical protein